MSRRSRRAAAMAATNTPQSSPAVAEAFSFGDPEPVLDGRDVLDLTESWWSGQWYEPPVSLDGLARSMRANPHHGSAIQLVANLLAGHYLPHPLLSRSEFHAFALNYMTFGNGYLQRTDNMLGSALRLECRLSKYMRRAKRDRYWWTPNYHERVELPAGSVFHLRHHDVNQELYGVPGYLAGLQSAWLNEEATLFRRKYYRNGSHAGFILYMTDTVHKEADIANLRQALKDAKGPGNFRNLFMYAPGGKKDGLQLMPISEVQAKDEFFNIKNVSRDDILAAHRVPPQLLGVVPANAGGFGDVEKAARVFAAHELTPLMERMKEINDWIGGEVIRFRPYSIEDPAAAG